MAGPLSPRTRWLLVIAGIALRLPGAMFNGMGDVFEMILDWGADVRALGIGPGLSFNYGSLSFALFGVAERLAEFIPRFWWLPFKLFTIAFEVGVVVALLEIVTPSLARLVLVAYWLNPWFVWHGAYQGFWEGPHMLFALLACLVLRRREADDRAWAIAGALLCLSWQAKPQGLVHLAAPLGLLLLFHFLAGRRSPLLWYSGGFIAAAAALSLVLWISGGPLLALWYNFRSSGNDAYLSHGGPGIWRFVYFIYMQIKGVSGEVYSYRPPRAWAIATTGGALAFSLVILAALLRRLRAAPAAGRRPTFEHAYLALTAGALVMSQFAPRAHINHSYGAMVMLIPLLPGRRWLTRAWLVSVLVLGYAHVSRYQMGATMLLPDDGVIQRYGHVQALADAVKALPAFSAPDSWLRVQANVNAVLERLPGQAFVSVLSLLVGVAAVVIAIALFDMAKTGRVPGLRAAGIGTSGSSESS